MLELEHLGALPELEELCCSQQWQTSSSFSDLELTGSGSATSWLGCYLLMDVEEEEYSSKLLSQEFIAAPQPVPVMVPQPAAAPATTISGYSSAASLYSGCMPYGAAYTTAPAQGMPVTLAAVLPAPAPASPATSGSHQHSSMCGTSATAAVPLLAASRAASPEPDWRDEEAVCLAGLALQLAQGDANQAMAQLLAWAAAQ